MSSEEIAFTFDDILLAGFIFEVICLIALIPIFLKSPKKAIVVRAFTFLISIIFVFRAYYLWMKRLTERTSNVVYLLLPWIPVVIIIFIWVHSLIESGHIFAQDPGALSKNKTTGMVYWILWTLMTVFTGGAEIARLSERIKIRKLRRLEKENQKMRTELTTIQSQIEAERPDIKLTTPQTQPNIERPDIVEEETDVVQTNENANPDKPGQTEIVRIPEITDIDEEKKEDPVLFTIPVENRVISPLTPEITKVVEEVAEQREFTATPVQPILSKLPKPTKDDAKIPKDSLKDEWKAEDQQNMKNDPTSRGDWFLVCVGTLAPVTRSIPYVTFVTKGEMNFLQFRAFYRQCLYNYFRNIALLYCANEQYMYRKQRNVDTESVATDVTDDTAQPNVPKIKWFSSDIMKQIRSNHKENQEMVSFVKYPGNSEEMKPGQPLRERMEEIVKKMDWELAEDTTDQDITDIIDVWEQLDASYQLDSEPWAHLNIYGTDSEKEIIEIYKDAITIPFNKYKKDDTTKMFLVFNEFERKIMQNPESATVVISPEHAFQPHYFVRENAYDV